MVVLTILPPDDTRASHAVPPRLTAEIRYRKRVTASDPADEATGVVGDGASPDAARDADRVDPPVGVPASAQTSPEHSAFAADALFAGDAPPPTTTLTTAVPPSAVAVDALFTDADTTGPGPVADGAVHPAGDPAGDPAVDDPIVDPEPLDTDEPVVDPVPVDEDPTAILVAPDARWAGEEAPATALTWVDTAAVARNTTVATLDEAAEPDAADALMRGARLRPAIARPGVLVPLGALVALLAAYSGTTLLWPLHEVPPTVQAVEFTPVPAPAATITWPARGSASIGIAGVSTAASAADAVSIASITKVVSSLMVLDRMPLAPGEQGPEFFFDYGDSVDYWNYRRADQSALDVPVDGVLTEYQLLQGTLLGSANNYIDRLSSEIWGSDEEFAAAAEIWLRERGLSGITVVTPSGFDERNVATPDALIRLGEWAMKNPVFAEIVRTPSVDLPGAGTVVNTNGMLADPGVVGIKTGTLVGWNLLTAKDVTVGETTVHLFAAVLDQADDKSRLAATRSLFAEAEAALQAQAPAVAKGTVVGEVTTIWGESVDVVTEADADVVLWNGAAATGTAAFDLGDEREEDGTVGTLTTVGPLDSVTTPLALAEDVEGPSPWWRLTHPLELLGITADKLAAKS